MVHPPKGIVWSRVWMLSGDGWDPRYRFMSTSLESWDCREGQFKGMGYHGKSTILIVFTRKDGDFHGLCSFQGG